MGWAYRALTIGAAAGGARPRACPRVPCPMPVGHQPPSVALQPVVSGGSGWVCGSCWLMGALATRCARTWCSWGMEGCFDTNQECLGRVSFTSERCTDVQLWGSISYHILFCIDWSASSRSPPPPPP
jgi:hypothetical protein